MKLRYENTQSLHYFKKPGSQNGFGPAFQNQISRKKLKLGLNPILKTQEKFKTVVIPITQNPEEFYPF